MITAKQIAALLRSEEHSPDNDGDGLWQERAAEKIAALLDDGGATVAAAQLENEVTSTLVDMTIATVLATLIEEEGGGRSNIAFSAMAMDHMMKHYEYTSEMDGLVRNMKIKLRENSDLNDAEAWRAPSNRHGVMHQDESGVGAKPQAGPHDYNRPVWAIAYFDEDGKRLFAKMSDHEDCKRHLADYIFLSRPYPTIENRFCVHPECPAAACTRK